MIRRTRYLAGTLGAILLSTSLAAQDPEPQPIPTLLEGLTLDVATGFPFPNVQLRFDTGERITSDKAGRYSIEGIEPGYHRIALVTGRCSVTFADVRSALMGVAAKTALPRTNCSKLESAPVTVMPVADARTVLKKTDTARGTSLWGRMLIARPPELNMTLL